MVRTLLALVIGLLVQFPNRTCMCGAAEHALPASTDDPIPHEHHDDDCPASQPVPKWKAVKVAPADLPAADAGVTVAATPVFAAESGAVFVPAAPPPPGVPIYLSVCVLRN